MRYPPLTHTLDTTKSSPTFVSLRHHIQGRTLHMLPSPPPPRSRSQQSDNIKVINRARRCYPATIQYPGDRRSKHCVRTQLPKRGDHAQHCKRRGRSSRITNASSLPTTAVASEHNSRGTMHSIVDDADYTVAGQGVFDAWNVELCSVRARVGRQCYRGWGKMLLLPSGVIDAMTLRKEEAFDVRKRVVGETRESSARLFVLGGYNVTSSVHTGKHWNVCVWKGTCCQRDGRGETMHRESSDYFSARLSVHKGRGA